MAWQSIVETDLDSVLLESIRSLAASNSRTDPVLPTITRVVDEVRGYCQAGGITLGLAGTIPSRLVSAALAIIRFRLATILPAAGLLTDEQKTENADALKLLGDVAAGRFAVEEPTTADTETSSAASPSFHPRHRHYSRHDENGI